MADKKTTEEVVEEVAAEEVSESIASESVATEGETVTITAGDLNTMVKIIDAGSQRGAWRGEELTTVGGLREKLVSTINSLNPAAEEDAAAEEAAA